MPRWIALCLLFCLVLGSTSCPIFAQEEQEIAEHSARQLLDVEYARAGDRSLRLDLLLPKQPRDPMPLVVWVHGGGWKGGNKSGAGQAASLLKHGYAVASLEYRFSNVATFPAQIHDCKAGIRWLRAHAGEYGYDPDRIGVFGRSAGGHLVALLGTSGDVADLEGDLGDHTDVSSRVQAVCDFFGPSDFIAWPNTAGHENRGEASASSSQLIGGSPLENPEAAKRVSPTTYITADDPPFFIVHGDQDPLVPVDQSTLLRDRLQAAGIPVELRVLHKAKHGGKQFHDPKLLEEIAVFFDGALKSAPSGARTEGN